MDSIKEFNEKKYDEVFELVHNSLKEQKEKGTITIESLESLLHDQYIFSDLDWLGRGEIKHIKNKATIAAIEIVLVDWREEFKDKK